MYMTEGSNEMVNSARKICESARRDGEKKRIETEVKQQKDMNDKENHDNLDAIAKNSNEAIKNLHELNEALKKNNELLEEKNKSLELGLNNIHEVLEDIFTVNCQSAEIQQEQIEQINALIGQISESLNRGEKVNWKDKIADASVQTVIAAIGAILKINGIL